MAIITRSGKVYKTYVQTPAKPRVRSNVCTKSESSIERVKHNADILIQELNNTSPACELMTAKLNEYGINMMHLAFRVHIDFTPEYIKKIVHRAAKQFQNRSDTIYAIEFGEESPFSTSYFIKIRLFMQESK